MIRFLMNVIWSLGVVIYLHHPTTIKPCFSYSLTIWTTYGRKLLQETTKMINIIRQYASTSGKSTSIVGLCLLLNTAFIISHLELTTCISVDILEFILKYPEKEVDFDVCFQIWVLLKQWAQLGAREIMMKLKGQEITVIYIISVMS